MCISWTIKCLISWMHGATVNGVQRFTSFDYLFFGDTLSSPNDKKDCTTQCLVCKELDMTSMKAAVYYFDILFLNSPEETEENLEITQGIWLREGDFNPLFLENKG